MKAFSELFKKYRLKAEFSTVTSFANELSKRGYYYQESIFSHWQKGSRIPTNRQLILTILDIFIQKNAIQTIETADEFLESAKQGHLTENEKEHLSLQVVTNAPFQVPSEIAHFTGREDILQKVQDELFCGNVLLLYGPPGVGKTALAIKLGHLFRDSFPEGVLWYKVDSSNIEDILLSIARLFGEDISNIKDIEVRASIVRTLLSKKKILLIFDNVSNKDNLNLLMPNSSSCCVVFSSQENLLNISSDYISIPVHVFTHNEVLKLYENVFDKKYVTKHKKEILILSERIGTLPLAVHMVASHIKQFHISLTEYMKQLDEEQLDLQALKYEDTNLLKAVTIGFNTLDIATKNVFISLGIFEGKDFSADAVAFINNITKIQAVKMLHHLLDVSFIEESDNKRYRIHPLMKMYARKQTQSSSLYLRAAFYYEKLLAEAEKEHSYKILMREVDNIIYVFKKCYENGYWDEVITLWNPIEKFLSDINEIKKLRFIAQTIDTTPSINTFQMFLTIYLVFLVVFWIGLISSGLKTSNWNYIYSILFSLVPFIGGFVGFILSGPRRSFSNIGKAVFFISLGLFSWGSGSMIWAGYNFFQNLSVPYPSLADLGYFPAYFFWITGIIYLSRATGAKFELKQKKSKFFLLVIPFIIITLSYYFLLFLIKRSYVIDNYVKIFFDLAYPSMDIVILTIAVIIFGLSVNFFGGKYKLSIFAILCGFTSMYFADFTFSYTTSLNIYFNGDFGDFIFTIALYLMTWGTLSFYLTPKKISSHKK